MGMAECAAHEGNLSQAQELLSWMCSILSGLRIPGKVSYLDRAEVILLSRQARYSNAAGDMATAEGYLRRAAGLAGGLMHRRNMVWKIYASAIRQSRFLFTTALAARRFKVWKTVCCMAGNLTPLHYRSYGGK